MLMILPRLATIRLTRSLHSPPSDAPVWVSTIDHLPTLLPKESSDRYCADLLPSIKSLDKVWLQGVVPFVVRLPGCPSLLHSDPETKTHFPSQLDSESVWQHAIKLFNEKKVAATATA